MSTLEAVVVEISKVADEMNRAISLCNNPRLFNPALVLAYSCISIMSSFNWELGESERDGDMFKKWVNDYMALPTSELDITAVELYACRNGMVHNYSPSSDLSTKGKARQVCIAYGTANSQECSAFIKNLPMSSQYAVIDLNELLKGIREGIEAFRLKCIIDGNKRLLVSQRIKNYVNIPGNIISRQIEL